MLKNREANKNVKALGLINYYTSIEHEILNSTLQESTERFGRRSDRHQ